MILRKTKTITQQPFAALDIGSSKICCMIGESDGSGGVRLLGHGTHASAGIRSGEVSDLDALSSAIGNTVQSAEREAGLSVHSASVVVPGGKPVSSINTRSLTLSDAIVRRRDINRLTARDDPAAVPAGYQPMHIQTQRQLPFSWKASSSMLTPSLLVVIT